MVYQNIFKLSYWALTFILYKAFIKRKKRSGLISLPPFLHDLSRKIFFTLNSIISTNFIAWLSLLFEILGNMCIVIICCPDYDVINFKIKLNYFTKSFSYMTKRSGPKCKYLENKKWNKMHFSSFLKGFQLSNSFLDLRVDLKSFIQRSFFFLT